MRVWPGGKDFRLFKAVYLGWLLDKYFVKVPYMVPIKIPGSLNLNPNETKFIKIFKHLHILIKKN
jgi:hypothetical protein